MRKSLKNILKFISLWLIVFIVAGNLKAQNDVQISHFMFDKLSTNPVYAGQNPSAINATLIARQQWVGFETAPSTQVFNFDTYVNNFGGVGLSLINDKLGYENSLNIKLAYAYHLKLGEGSFASGGLGVGILNKALQGSKLVFKEQDPIGIYNDVQKLNPDFYFGLGYCYKDLSFGISSTHINQFFMEKNFFNVPPHYYIYLNYFYKLSDRFDIAPAIHIRRSPIISYYEFNTNLLYQQWLMFGLSYRWNESVIGLISCAITKNVKIGYSYDLNIGDVKGHSSGSHEIMLTASFQKPQKTEPYKTFRSPRFF